MDITANTLPYAQAAIRDILYLYVDMIQSYRGFGHGLDAGLFLPLEFINAKTVCPLGSSFELDESLLHVGSSIAILCSISDCLDEVGVVSAEWTIIAMAKDAFDAGRFCHMPKIHEAFRLAFDGDEPAFREQLAGVYRHHVLAYFSELIAV